MRREASVPRSGWQHRLEQIGFDFYNLEGKAYWTEQACYAFSAAEIDEVEAASEELHGLCLKAVEHVVANKLWERMRIPPAWGEYIERVWRRNDPTLCGRFDLAYDGKEPPKLLEYNADTPTALYEAAVVQWYWLKDVKPEADQFNSIHEKLIEAWRAQAAVILAAIGWPAAPLATRPFPGGAILAIGAPLDALYSATLVNEWACEAADAELAGAALPPLGSAAAAIERELRYERDPSLLAMAAAAERRGVAFVAGDGKVSVGLGAGALVWPYDQLPAPEAEIGRAHV